MKRFIFEVFMSCTLGNTILFLKSGCKELTSLDFIVVFALVGVYRSVDFYISSELYNDN